jgi:hypothetical protein
VISSAITFPQTITVTSHAVINNRDVPIRFLLLLHCPVSKGLSGLHYQSSTLKNRPSKYGKLPGDAEFHWLVVNIAKYLENTTVLLLIWAFSLPVKSAEWGKVCSLYHLDASFQ